MDQEIKQLNIGHLNASVGLQTLSDNVNRLIHRDGDSFSVHCGLLHALAFLVVDFAALHNASMHAVFL